MSAVATNVGMPVKSTISVHAFVDIVGAAAGLKIIEHLRSRGPWLSVGYGTIACECTFFG